MQAAKSTAVRLSVTLTLRQGRCTSRKVNRLRCRCACTRNLALQSPRLGLDRLANLADELGRAFVETDHRALPVRLFSMEVEHVFHAGDKLAVDVRDAPHVLAPGLVLVLMCFAPVQRTV